MIDRYTIKVAPAVSHKDIIKTLDATKEYDPEQLKKLQHLKIRIEVIGEAADYKKISDLLKELKARAN
jgi:hypothetical protein